jgi:multicomponent Na+:H+ antiporter subunit D
MAAFTVAALGMIGLPPTAGFISKWYLGIGALQADHGWVVAVLIGSALLNAAYFLPLLRRIWFAATPAHWPAERPHPGRAVSLALVLPPFLTALAVLAWGLFASTPGLPLHWVKFIAAWEYGP